MLHTDIIEIQTCIGVCMHSSMHTHMHKHIQGIYHTPLTKTIDSSNWTCMPPPNVIVDSTTLIQEVSKLSLVAYGCPNFGAEFRTFCTELSYFMILYLRQSKHMGYTPICIYFNYKIVWYGGLILFY